MLSVIGNSKKNDRHHLGLMLRGGTSAAAKELASPLEDDDYNDDENSQSSSNGDDEDELFLEDESSCDEENKSSTNSSSKSSGKAGTAGSRGGDRKSKEELRKVKQLAKRETQYVALWRMLSVLVLITSTVIVTWLAYMLIHRMDKKGFDHAVVVMGETIQQTPHASIDKLVVAQTELLSEVFTSQAASNNQTWPFVRLQMFEQMYGEQARISSQGGVELIYAVPLVSQSDLHAWEEYSDKEALYEKSPDRPIAYQAWTYGNTTGTSIPMEMPSTGDVVAPIWQVTPRPVDLDHVIKYDMLSNSQTRRDMYDFIQSQRTFALGPIRDDFNDYVSLNSFLPEKQHAAFHQQLSSAANSLLRGKNRKLQQAGTESIGVSDLPHSALIHPIYESMPTANSSIVGLIVAVLSWDFFIQSLLPNGLDSTVHAVLHNSCGELYTYRLWKGSTTFVGAGDLHEEAFTKYEFTMTIPSSDDGNHYCDYYISVYPTQEMYDLYVDKNAPAFAAVLGLCLGFIVIIFARYNSFVQAKHNKITAAAVRSGAIVSTFFPSHFRDRIVGNSTSDSERTKKNNSSNAQINKNEVYTKYVNGQKDGASDDDSEDGLLDSRPIADFYPETTIMFADMAGFTAWSSMREPRQVFVLLETVYCAFDRIAKRRRVFKVETIGDCYVAVCGLPDPRKDHAIVMARFARDCMAKMRELTKTLEVKLGPDTVDLCLRIGLHSGAVTAGVLRGEGARFQLFGDAMNLAARMEKTGLPGRIQLSKETAEKLKSSGKDSWIVKRDDRIQQVKDNNGEVVNQQNTEQDDSVETYWLTSSRSHKGSSASSNSGSSDMWESSTGGTDHIEDGSVVDMEEEKIRRLVEWNAKLVSRLVKQIMVIREKESATYPGTGKDNVSFSVDSQKNVEVKLEEIRSSNPSVLDELLDTIPMWRTEKIDFVEAADSVDLSETVEGQIFDFIRTIASIHRDSPFHNFEQASHSLLAAGKILNRIAGPGAYANNEEDTSSGIDGIRNDPLVQLAIVFACLIYQVDHPGVPNSTVVQENPELVALYGSKSINEQKAVHLAWDTLMESSFKDFRYAIFGHSVKEERRFRQLVVNAVLAADVSNPDLEEFRRRRWEKAFGKGNRDEHHDLRATVMLELMTQASTMSFTMQYWHLYQKWNGCLFSELYAAYCDRNAAVFGVTKAARTIRNPAETWYQDQLQFFDGFVLPLAEKLKASGMFGSSSCCDEYISYATTNRRQWEKEGEAFVEELTRKASTAV